MNVNNEKIDRAKTLKAVTQIMSYTDDEMFQFLNNAMLNYLFKRNKQTWDMFCDMIFNWEVRITYRGKTPEKITEEMMSNKKILRQFKSFTSEQ